MSPWNADPQNIVGGNCEYASSVLGGLNSPAAQCQYIRNGFYCAGDTGIYTGGAGCGQCYRLTYRGVNRVVEIVDHGTYTFECHMTAFTAVTGTDHGVVTVDYEAVPCECACAVAAVLDNPNPSYTKIIIADLPYPVLSATARFGHQPVAMHRNDGAVWAMMHAGINGAVSFSATMSNGVTRTLDSCFEVIWPIFAGDSCRSCPTTTLATTTTPWTTSTRTTTTTTSTTATTTVTTRTTTPLSTPTTSIPRFACPYEMADVGDSSGSLGNALLPDPFYDEVHVETAMLLSPTLAEEGGLAHIHGDFSCALATFVGLRPPSVATAVLPPPPASPGPGPPPSAGAGPRAPVRVPLTFRVYPGGDVSAEQVRQLLEAPGGLELLNELLEGVGQLEDETQRGTDDGSSAAGLGRRLSSSSAGNVVEAGQCPPWSLLCCENVVVYSIVHNAGVFIPYSWFFPMSLVLLLAMVAILLPARRSRSRGEKGHRRLEAARGWFVMPLFIMCFVFQGIIVTAKSMDKFQMLMHQCQHEAIYARAAHCPANAYGLLLEVVLFACLPVAVTGMFAVWCCQQWQRDCESEVKAPQQDLKAEVALAPLEAVLRRSPLLAFMEVRQTDIVSRSSHVLLVVLNGFLSCAVVLISFFGLQRYEIPGRFTAWLPYKLIFEVIAVTLLKYIVKMIVRKQVCGVETTTFLTICIILAVGVDAWLWTTLLITCSGLHVSGWHHVRQVLDIAVGAGILNVILSSITCSMAMHVGSVYVYEPIYRARRARSLCLTDPAEVERLRAGFRWQVKGHPTLHGQRVIVEGFRKDEDAEDEELDQQDDLEWVRAEADLNDSGGSSPAALQRPRRKRGGSMGSASTSVSWRAPPLRQAVVPSAAQPVVVEVRRANLGKLRSRLLDIMDLLFSVDPGLPVRCLCKRPGEHEADDSKEAEAEEEAAGGNRTRYANSASEESESDASSVE